MRGTQQAALDYSLVGMTVTFPRLDLESALEEIAAAGYGSVEVFTGQLGPGVFDVPEEMAHAAAAREHIERLGLRTVMLNAVDSRFDPLIDPESSIDALGNHLKIASALGSPRLMVWDGQPSSSIVNRADAPRLLADCVAESVRRSGVVEPAAIAIELHPFTFALADDLLEPVCEELRAIGAGIVLDFAHFGVALGPEFARRLSQTVLSSVTHVHWCDTDCVTGGFHLPPGQGCLDLDAVDERLAPLDVWFSFDLFGWPSPRHAMRTCRDAYRTVARRHANASVATQ